MPQEFQVLQCFSCRTFQVHQVKKTLKWACKMCGEKQSVIKVYGRGSGTECRQHVQTLNSMRGQLEEVKGQGHGQGQRLDDSYPRENYPPDSEPGEFQTGYRAKNGPQESGGRWGAYMEPGSSVDQEENDSDNQSTEVLYTTDATLFKSRKRKSYGKDRTQCKHPKFTEEKVQSSAKTRQTFFTDECEDSQENYSYDQQVYHKPAHVPGLSSSKTHHRKGTSRDVSSLPEAGTSSSKWGMYVSNEPPSGEYSSGEDNSDNFQYDTSRFDLHKSKSMSKTDQNSNEDIKQGVSGNVSSSSKWSMFMPDSQLPNSTKPDQGDCNLSESPIQPPSYSVKSCVPQTKSKWGQFLDVEPAERSPVLSSLTNKTEERKTLSASQSNVAPSVASNSKARVDARSLFSLGELSDDDLEF